jgi:hypothetical protein
LLGEPKRLAALQAEVAATDRAFSEEAQRIGLGLAFAQYGTADSMNVGGPADAGFVLGAEAIARMVAQGEPATSSSARWSSERTVVASSGDLGLSIGFILVNVPEGQPERPPIPFFTVWRRADLASPWRYVAE